MNYTQRSYVNGKWENMYPATTAEQVTTDENHQFVTDAQIKEFSQWFRVVGTGTAADDNRVFLRAFTGKQWNLAQIKNLQNICIAHFVLNCNPQKIHLFHRRLCFQCKKGDSLFFHYFMKVNPGGIDALTVNVLPLVEHII